MNTQDTQMVMQNSIFDESVDTELLLDFIERCEKILDSIDEDGDEND